MKQFLKDLLYIAACAFIGTIIGFGMGTCSARAQNGPSLPPLRIAVVDTGFNAALAPNVKLCNTGHRDFTPDGIITDTFGHGTNVTDLIAQEAGPTTNYCVIVVKYNTKSFNNISQYISALRYLETLRPDVVNLSLSGTKYSIDEDIILNRLLDAGVHIVAAAGNNGWDLSHSCLVYPACVDSRILVVGNVSPQSNVGRPVDIVLDGQKRKGGGVTLSGTSQSAALASGNLLRYLHEQRTTVKIKTGDK